MTVREDREVAAPPAMTLAALATAGENMGWTVRDVRAKPGLLLMSSGLSLRGVSLGFILTARARRFNKGSRLAIDVTPVLGSWARKSADDVLDDLLHEFQLVMQAPHARIRKPQRRSAGRPFGRVPVFLAALWAACSLLFLGLLLGGLWWIPAGLGALGALLILLPRQEPWWNHLVAGLAVLSLPFGLLGLVARRMARANDLWHQTLEPFQ